MLKTYRGSCHCRAVRFEADIDFEIGTGRCNCSICAKKRGWEAIIQPDQFRLLSGKDALRDYQFGTLVAHHPFCATCGISCYGEGFVEEIGGAYVAISISCLDGVPDEELAAVPVRYLDGRHNNWWNEPEVTSHL